MSWLQQLVGKLKSVFRRESATGEAKKEAPTPVTKETPAEPAAAAPADPAEKAAGAAQAETPAAATETTAADPGTSAKEDTADSTTTAEPDTATTEAVEEKSAEAEPAPVVAEEPVAEEAAEPEPVAQPAPAAEEVTAEEAAAEEAPAPKREATNPAISTLDVENITAELKAEGPYGPGSGKPAADGSAPSADFTVKAKESSKLFHTEKSPYFSRTKADVWFKSEADAESAGFQAWDHKKRAATKK